MGALGQETDPEEDDLEEEGEDDVEGLPEEGHGGGRLQLGGHG